MFFFFREVQNQLCPAIPRISLRRPLGCSRKSLLAHLRYSLRVRRSCVRLILIPYLHGVPGLLALHSAVVSLVTWNGYPLAFSFALLRQSNSAELAKSFFCLNYFVSVLSLN